MAATADTAKLLASLDLQDNMSAKLRGAIGNVSAAEGAVGRLGTRLNTFATSLKGGIANALTTFSGRLKQFGSIALTSLGVGGLFGVGALIKGAIDKVRDFGDEVIRLSSLTGDSVETTSAFASALEHFGIAGDQAQRLVGMAVKNLGNYAGTAEKAKAFQDPFGFSLLDSSGKVKDFNALLLTAADYYTNKLIPPQTKAAGLSKIFGRSWQQLVPILKEGSKGILAVEQEAKNLGLTLTTDNIQQISDLKDATREWDTALGGLQLQIGLQLVPRLKDLATAATGFVRDHGKEIVRFFGDLADFAGKVGGTIADFAGKVAAFWGSIPGPLRDLLVKGIIADRTIKFFFGISPIKLVASLATGALTGVASVVGRTLVGKLVGAGIGKAFVQPVWVTNPGFGSGGGGPGAVAGGRNWTGIGATIAGAVIIPAVLQEVWNNLQSSPFGATFQQLQSQANANIAGTENLLQHGTIVDLQNALAGLQDMPNHLDPLQKVLYELNASGVKTHTETLEAAIRDEIQSRLDDQKREDFRDANRERRERSRTAVEKAKGSIDWQKMAETLKKSAAAAIKDVAQQLKNANLAASRLSHQRALTIASRMETHLQSTVHVTVNTRVSVSDVRKASYSSSSAYDTAVNTFGNKVDLIGDLGP